MSNDANQRRRKPLFGIDPYTSFAENVRDFADIPSSSHVIAELEQAMLTGADEKEIRGLQQRFMGIYLIERSLDEAGHTADAARAFGKELLLSSAGHDAPLLQPARITNPGQSPDQLRDIGKAIRYREAVQNGLIDDPHVWKTLQEAFGGADISRGGLVKETIKGWCRKGIPEVYRSTATDPEVIVTDMLAAGRHYSENFSRAARAENIPKR